MTSHSDNPIAADPNTIVSNEAPKTSNTTQGKGVVKVCRIQTACYPNNFIILLEKIRSLLHDGHFYLIDRTPFVLFFHLGRQFELDTRLVHYIIGHFDERKNIFRFGRKYFSFHQNGQLYNGQAECPSQIAFPNEVSYQSNRSAPACNKLLIFTNDIMKLFRY